METENKNVETGAPGRGDDAGPGRDGQDRVLEVGEGGGRYLVRGGNHCVSIARFHGAEAIEAEVVVVRGSPRPQT